MPESYPLGDYPAGMPLPSRMLRAVRTGETRAPRKGEWYISGAIPTAYRAYNDLSQSYAIARLVRIERIVTERIVEV